jgi:hypothetical protein
MFERAKHDADTLGRTSDVLGVVEKIEGTIAGLKKLAARQSRRAEAERQLAGLVALRDQIRVETGH